jgi:carbonic anhydrase
MTSPNLKRRQCLIGACGLGLGMALNVGAEAPLPKSTSEGAYLRNADEVLARLKAGNQRFIDDKPLQDRRESSWRSLLTLPQ